MISSLKPAHGGGIALRVYECHGQPASAALLAINASLATVNEINLMEDPGRMVPLAEDGLRFDLHPYEIKTFLLRPAPARVRRPLRECYPSPVDRSGSFSLAA